MTLNSTLLDINFKPDCASCSALCCVAPAFDVEQGFAYNKEAHIPCVNLQEDFRCGVHKELASCGFSGCVIYDCYGAGQWVTQKLFPNINWRDSPQQAEKIFSAFYRVKVLRELMLLLTTALQHITDPGQTQMLKSKLFEIEGLCFLTNKLTAATDLSSVTLQTMELLQSLQATSAIARLKSRQNS